MSFIRRILKTPTVWPSPGYGLLIWGMLMGGIVQTQAQNVPLHFMRLSTEHGLSQHSIYAIHQDKMGFLWLGTLEGLNRYDGHQFKTYTLPDLNRAINQTIVSIVEDRDERLWLGTRSGLFLFNRMTETFTSIPLDTLPPRMPSIVAMVEDHEGTIWIASAHHGLYCIDDNTPHAVSVSIPKPSAASSVCITSLFRDSADNLWMGTKKNGLFFKSRSQQFWRAIPLTGLKANEWINTIAQDGEGHIWLGSTVGAWQQRSNGGFIRNKSGVTIPNILTLFRDSQNHLWIGTEDGLFLKPYHSDKPIKMILDPQRLHNPQNRYVRCFHEDKFHSIWVGSWGGLYQTLYQTKPFITLTPDIKDPNSIHGAEIFSVMRDSQGGLWLAHENGVDHLVTHKKIEHHSHVPGDHMGPGARKVMALATDSKGQIWMGTTRDLTVHQPGTQIWKHHPLPRQANGSGPALPRILKFNSQGKLWIGTAHGLYTYSESEQKYRHISSPSTEIDIFSMAFDGDDDILLGTWTGLLIYRYATGSISRVHLDTLHSAFDSECIRSIYRESARILWLGSRGHGLIRLDRQTGDVQYYRHRNKLPQNWIQAIIPDKQGHLWTSTNDGICRFSPKDGTFRPYLEETGLWQREFNLGSACLYAPKGTICFGAMGGAVIFNPERIIDENEKPIIRFTDLEINGFKHNVQHSNTKNDAGIRALCYMKSITLPPSTKMVKISFSAMSFSSPKNNRYYYKLTRGHMVPWQALGHQNEVTLGPLKPGSYTLDVKGSNGDGVMSVKPSRLQIVILPLWYQHPAAKFTILGVMIAVSILLLRLRTVQIQNRNRWLTKMVKQRTSELSESNYRLEVELQQRLHAESQLREHSKNLEKTVQENTHHILQLRKREFQNKKLAAMGRATSTVVHEIRNPLASLKISISALSSRLSLHAREKQCLDLAVHDVARMELMLKEMLSFTKPMQFHFAFDGLNEVIQAALKDFTDACEDTQVLLTQSLSKTLPPIRMDLRRIDQAVRHIIQNALSAMPEGGKLDIKSDCDIMRGEVILIFKDNGRGIQKDHLNRIYEPFFTGHLGGTGLGLTIVKKIIEAHGGDIHIESESHKGTTVKVRLPIDNGLTQLTEEELPSDL